MNILIVIGSVIVIAASAATLKRLFGWMICPLCAGVAGTWVWILAGMYGALLPREEWQLLSAILMGGSTVGIIYQLERRRGEPLSARVKVALFLLGFIAAYGLLTEAWVVAAPGAALFAASALFLMKKPASPPKDEYEKLKELEERMKQCC